ncbi:MAG: PIN domain-containing protein, partial [Alkalispirochaeta sp.]
TITITKNNLPIVDMVPHRLRTRRQLGTLAGQITVPDDFDQEDPDIPAMENSGFDVLPLTAAHAARLRTLPFHHRDPFDRMLIAQALVEEIPVASVNEQFRLYPIPLVS